MNRNRRLEMCLLATTLLITAAGCSPANGTSTLTSPREEAMLSVSEQPVVFCADSCVFEGPGANRGLGCAAGVHGVTAGVSVDDRILQRVHWQLSSSWVIRPGESFLYDGCCLEPLTVRHAIRYQTEVSWQNVPCPAS